MNWRWISIAAFLGALVIAYGALNRRERAPQGGEALAETPAYYLEDAVISEMRQDGSLHLQMHAQRIEQRTNNDDILMQSVRLNYIQAPGSEWVLSAERAVRTANSPIVQLSGNVEVRPLSAPANAALRTDALAVDMERSIAYSTRSPVQIEYGPYTMDVRDFRFDFEQQRIDMVDIHGRYNAQ